MVVGNEDYDFHEFEKVGQLAFNYYMLFWYMLALLLCSWLSSENSLIHVMSVRLAGAKVTGRGMNMRGQWCKETSVGDCPILVSIVQLEILATFYRL